MTDTPTMFDVPGLPDNHRLYCAWDFGLLTARIWPTRGGWEGAVYVNGRSVCQANHTEPSKAIRELETFVRRLAKDVSHAL